MTVPLLCSKRELVEYVVSNSTATEKEVSECYDSIVILCAEYHVGLGHMAEALVHCANCGVSVEVALKAIRRSLMEGNQCS